MRLPKTLEGALLVALSVAVAWIVIYLLATR